MCGTEKLLSKVSSRSNKFQMPKVRYFKVYKLNKLIAVGGIMDPKMMGPHS